MDAPSRSKLTLAALLVSMAAAGPTGGVLVPVRSAAYSASVPSSSAALPTWLEYVSPLPGSKLHLPETNLIVRLREGSGDVARVEASGSSSGDHGGVFQPCDDGRTFTYRPDHPFTPGETVTVRLERGAGPAGDGSDPFELSFSIAGPEREALRGFRLPLEADEASGWGRAPLAAVPADALHAGALVPDASPADTLPSDFPKIQTTLLGRASPGRLFLSSFSQADPLAPSYLLMLENDGSPFFHRRLPARAHDFKLQPDGRLTYYDDAAVAFYALDSTFAVVDSFRTGNGYTTDFHECIVLTNGHALLMSFDPQVMDMTPFDPKGFPDAIVIGLIVQEIDREKNVVFQWRSWDHFEITDAVGIPLGGRVVNYVHGNSIDVDPLDENLVVSCRSMNRVSKISRMTGAVLWTLGGVKNEFRLVNDPTGFSRQHSARRLPDGNLLLFDNGTFRSPPASRAIEYALDETRRAARLVWQYRHDPDVFGPFAGSVQRLPTGNTVIGWGTTTPTLSEVTPDGTLVYELTFEPGIFSYRAFRFEWPPIAFARVELSPRTLSLGVETGWVTAMIEPVGFDPAEIDIATVRLAGVVPAETQGAAVGDANGNGDRDLTVSFSRALLAPLLTPELTELEVSGALFTGERFHGFADVRVVGPDEMNRLARDAEGSREGVSAPVMRVLSAPGELPVRLATWGRLGPEGVEPRDQGGGATRILAVYDSRGRCMSRQRVDGGGTVVWDGRSAGGRRVAPGVYWIRIEGAKNLDPTASAAVRVVIVR